MEAQVLRANKMRRFADMRLVNRASRRALANGHFCIPAAAFVEYLPTRTHDYRKALVPEVMKAIWKEYDQACACAMLSQLALHTGREILFHQEQHGFWSRVKHALRTQLREQVRPAGWIGFLPLLPG
jgi:hypothetical protein